MYGIGCYCRATDYHYRTTCMVLAATVGPLTTIIGPHAGVDPGLSVGGF